MREPIIPIPLKYNLFLFTNHEDESATRTGHKMISITTWD
jgi:hypothetical protein